MARHRESLITAHRFSRLFPVILFTLSCHRLVALMSSRFTLTARRTISMWCPGVAMQAIAVR
jgi:hypothetical protein